LAQDATPTPQAEEESMTAEATAEPEEEPAEESMAATEPTIADLAEQVAALQAQLAEVQAMAQRNSLNLAIYLLDQAGLHALDVKLNEEGVLDAADSSRIGQVARLLTTVDWPADLAADADALTTILTDLAAGLDAEDMAISGPLATEAHDAQHALSHAAVAWLAGEHGDHDHAHGDAMAPAVTDVDGLLIENVLANLALPSTTGSVWLKITNNTAADEALTGATIPGCGVIELHDMKMENDVMTMFPVEGGEIVLPAGEAVELKRGGLHIMCIEKAAPVEVGTEVEITLHFATAGDVVVTAPVVDPGTVTMEMEHDHDAMGDDADHAAEGEGDTHSHD
jgi:copper(I)-binding protein